MMTKLSELPKLAATAVETAGIAAMLLGILVAAILAVRDLRRGAPEAYRQARQRVGRAILLSLELLVAADILRTIAEQPTLEHVLILAIVVLIRTFLSFALEVELEGRLPWHRKASRDSSPKVV